MELVYIINKDGNPLMPTNKKGWVRHLLQDKKAKVVDINPFTVKLNYLSKNETQPFIMGIDSGSQNIAVCIRKENGEVVFAGELETRSKEVTESMNERRMFRNIRRRIRRNKRKRRAKKCSTTFVSKVYNIKGCEEPLTVKDIKPKKIKFQCAKEKNWKTPTVTHLINSHINFIGRVLNILPISEIYFEYAAFDIQKIENPKICGTGYQNGEKKGFLNSQAYVLARDNYTCQICKTKNGTMNVHHIIPREELGSNKPSNLIILCEKCHKKVHKNKKLLESLKKIKVNKNYRATSIFNTAVPHIYNYLKSTGKKINITYGYETKQKRRTLNIEKTHYNDALLISLPENEISKYKEIKHVFKYKELRRRHRQIVRTIRDRYYKLDGKTVASNRHKRMGQATDSLEEFRESYPEKVSLLKAVKAIKLRKLNKYPIEKGDCVKHKGKYKFVKGLRGYGTKIGFYGESSQYVKQKEVSLVYKNKGYLILN